MTHPKTRERSTRRQNARFRARLRGVLLAAVATAPVAGMVDVACTSNAGSVTGTSDAAASVDSTTAVADADPSTDASALPTADAADATPIDPCAPVLSDAALFGLDGACDDFVRLPCGFPPDAGRVGCALEVDVCTATCPGRTFLQCGYGPTSCDDAGNLVPDADVYVECGLCVGDLGRKPEGLPTSVPVRASSAVGDYFARAAYLEAASVDAFHHLEAHLARHHAPVGLRRRAARAAEDEKRHARAMTRLARRHGAEPAAACVPSPAPIDLQTLARDNAVEGCVRESFAALLALHQAAHARDAHAARALRRIARDESSHAALSWAIDAFCRRRLDASARARLDAEVTRALAELGGGSEPSHEEAARSIADEAVADLVGLPSFALHQRLAREFARVFFPGTSLSGTKPSRRSRRAA